MRTGPIALVAVFVLSATAFAASEYRGPVLTISTDLSAAEATSRDLARNDQAHGDIKLVAGTTNKYTTNFYYTKSGDEAAAAPQNIYFQATTPLIAAPMGGTDDKIAGVMGGALKDATVPGDFDSTSAKTQQVQFVTPATKPSLMNTASLKQLYVVQNAGAAATNWPAAAASVDLSIVPVEIRPAGAVKMLTFVSGDLTLSNDTIVIPLELEDAAGNLLPVVVSDDSDNEEFTVFDVSGAAAPMTDTWRTIGSGIRVSYISSLRQIKFMLNAPTTGVAGPGEYTLQIRLHDNAKLNEGTGKDIVKGIVPVAGATGSKVFYEIKVIVLPNENRTATPKGTTSFLKGNMSHRCERCERADMSGL